MITEDLMKQAIAAAAAGRLRHEGTTYTYDQRHWCGTACCVGGFGRLLAGLPEHSGPLTDDEILATPYLERQRQLMTCTAPDIVLVMDHVQDDGAIDLSGADLSGANLPDSPAGERDG